MYNIQGGFIYIDCVTLRKNNPITIPGIFEALSRCNKIPVLINVNMDGSTTSGDAYTAHGICVCNYGYTDNNSDIILTATITISTPKSSTGMNISVTVTDNDVIKM